MARDVRLSSADRVLFPDDGITKGDLFEYYDAVAPVLVPHLRDRPFTMKRWREGIAGGSFFQKQAPKGIPDWLPTRTFTTHPREGGSREVDFQAATGVIVLRASRQCRTSRARTSGYLMRVPEYKYQL